jgi:hypothetical protein|tara:strand:+ start:27 stop:653 length:627 start_codon:yes stop_codon:yes gene_type:complete
MPGIKTTIYDGCVFLDDDTLDLTGVTAMTVNLAAGYAKGSTDTITVDGAAPTTLITEDSDHTYYLFPVGSRVYTINEEYVGTVKSLTSTTIVFHDTIKTSLVDDQVLYRERKYEIVGIMTASIATGTGDAQISLLQPVNSKWMGTVEPDGTSHVLTAGRDFGAVAGDGSPFQTGIALPAGVLYEGRWKKVTCVKNVICYLKACPTKGV